jgi:glycosyltransferase involved in cell wall biosynthesis
VKKRLTGNQKIGIIIPAYNPRFDQLKELIQRLKILPPGDRAKILIVDDGSDMPIRQDDFPPGIYILRHSVNQGKGGALRTGFHFFLKGGEDLLIITLDADLQHPPENLPDFIRAFHAGLGQIIVGYRKRKLSSMPFHRLCSNFLTSLIISVLTGRLIRDSQNGFRLIDSRVLRKLRLTETGFHLESEILIRAGWKGIRIGFVPIPTIYNLEKSSIHNVKDTVNFVRLIFQLLGERITGCTTKN